MKKYFNRQVSRTKRRKRVSLKINEHSHYPYLKVYRSLKHIYAAIIDNNLNKTIVSCSTLSKEVKESAQKTKGVEKAKLVGELIAKRSIGKGVKKVAFDKSGYVYHGVVKALADAARKGGLEF